ncbi:hypothetical protein G7Y89_g4902 [Cudoniella acicularis]|uniref:Cytochrome P450 n=1 Tax=Cudoniella acicularis TaxID=354080 RepID=A0A8H4W3V8_9HELO|nr:hypothetical protein G7Y89_g4902 [Cudoniella acicularis]
MALHKKYGPTVRIAPKEAMVSSPQSFRNIYGAGSNFRKSDWHLGTSDCGWRGPDDLDFLPEVNMEKYRMQRRAIEPAYTADAVKDYEENLDEILTKDIRIMHERAGRSVDLDMFLNMFAPVSNGPAQEPAATQTLLREYRSTRTQPSTDILAKLLSLQSMRPLLQGKDRWISSICLTNFGAGVETIAITVGTLIANVLSRPGCQECIHAEINEARKEGKLSLPPRIREV